jgi:preprotein translocase SecE subunit
MKRIISLILVLLFALSLCACNLDFSAQIESISDSIFNQVVDAGGGLLKEDTSSNSDYNYDNELLETDTSTETETDTEAVVDTSKAVATKKALIINGIIIGVIVIIGVVLFIRFRVKLMNSFRSVKSELGKVVWSSKEQTRKGFLVVIVVTVIFAVGLWVIDFAFSYGISELANLFN